MDQVPGKKVQADASTIEEIYCQPCFQDGESLSAEAYCTVCKEFMCSNCTQFHKKQRISKSHSLLDKSSMPTTMRGFTTIDESSKLCDIHPEECIKYFCPTHQTLNCGHCSVLDHQSCKQQIISEIAKAFKEGQGYEAIKQVIDKLLKDIDTYVTDVKENIKLVEDLGEHEIAKIRNYRDQINKYIDERENTLLKTIANIKNTDETLLHSLKLQFDDLKIEVNAIKTKLEVQEKNTSQLFIEAHVSKNLLEGLELTLAEIVKKKTIQKYQLRIDPATERLLGSNTGFGTIEKMVTSKCLEQRFERSSSTTQAKNEKNTTLFDTATKLQEVGDKKTTTAYAAANVQDAGDEITTTADACTNEQAVGEIQVFQKIRMIDTNTVPKPGLIANGTQSSAKPKQKKQTVVNTDLTSLEFTRAPDIPVKSPSGTLNCGLTSMLVLPEDRLLIADCNNDIVAMVDLKTSSLMSEVDVPSTALDMCLLPGDRVAVSMGCMGIQLIETRGKLVLKDTIKVGGDCHGICYHNECLIVSYNGGNVEKINMEGKVLKKVSDSWLSRKPFKYPWYVAVVSDGLTEAIYVSDFDKNTITKLDMDLNIHQTFQNPALRGPTGITAVDNQLLICGLFSNNILCLDLPSGQMTKLLRISTPRSVCFSHQQNKI
ncbi:uncharacterized protein LOC128238629 isoform X2 [Mya arenaria]|uniref:uncharacterized protein LOC128238629 isoform X2 n=1 Tax=Mya arenaria TaxID=6604 RepID=UPI0022E94BF3|nr:uncharacterized protein LOC128238629 isoform X2 [Mya arenaria]